MKHVRALLCAILLIPAIFPDSSVKADIRVPRVWHDVTVVTADGWDYPGVSVRWLADHDALEVIRSDGARRIFAPEDLRTILDAEGRDITVHVTSATVSRRYHPDQGVVRAPPPERPFPAAPSRQPYAEIGAVESAKHTGPRCPVAAQERASGRRFVVALSAEVGHGWSREGWYDTDERGTAYGLRLRSPVSDAVYLLFGYRRQELERPQRYVDRSLLEIDAFYAGLGLMGRFRSYGEPLPYLEVAYARINHDDREPPNYADELCLYDCNPGFGRESYSGLLLNIGLMIPLGKAAALDIGGSYLYAGQNAFDFRQDDFYSLMSAQAGLSLFVF